MGDEYAGGCRVCGGKREYLRASNKSETVNVGRLSRSLQTEETAGVLIGYEGLLPRRYVSKTGLKSYEVSLA